MFTLKSEIVNFHFQGVKNLILAHSDNNLQRLTLDDGSLSNVLGQNFTPGLSAFSCDDAKIVAFSKSGNVWMFDFIPESLKNLT